MKGRLLANLRSTLSKTTVCMDMVGIIILRYSQGKPEKTTIALCEDLFTGKEPEHSDLRDLQLHE